MGSETKSFARIFLLAIFGVCMLGNFLDRRCTEYGLNKMRADYWPSPVFPARFLQKPPVH